MEGIRQPVTTLLRGSWCQAIARCKKSKYLLVSGLHMAQSCFDSPPGAAGLEMVMVLHALWVQTHGVSCRRTLGASQCPLQNKNLQNLQSCKIPRPGRERCSINDLPAWGGGGCPANLWGGPMLTVPSLTPIFAPPSPCKLLPAPSHSNSDGND